MARPEGVEPPTAWFVARYSIQLSYGRIQTGGIIHKVGGERGIRTLDGLLTHTPLAGERLQPLGHLSVIANFNSEQIISNLRSGLLGATPLAPSGPPSLHDDVVSHLRCSARTLDGLLTHTPLAGERLQPLGHLSRNVDYKQADKPKRHPAPARGVAYRCGSIR